MTTPSFRLDGASALVTGAATGLGGTAPRNIVPGLMPWLAMLAAGLLLVASGATGLRRSRRTVAAVRD